MNDFEAPKLRDTDPPRVFNTVTTRTVQYNMDFVEYLMNQESLRREKEGVAQLTNDEAVEFRKQIVSTLIVQGNAEAAIALRPAKAVSTTQRQQLNG